MKITELATKVAEEVRGNKEQWLATLHKADDMTDVRNIVHGYRGEDPVIMLMPLRTDRDDTLAAARLAAVAFGCDTISFTSESWHPAEEYKLHNPITGVQVTLDQAKGGEVAWGPGSMQDAAENHDGLNKGWVVECLMTTVVNRAGDLALVNQDYKINRKTNALGITTFSIDWDEPLVLDTGNKAEASGVVPEALVRFMNMPTIWQEMARMGVVPQRDFGLDDVEAQAHADCATVKFLIGTGEWEGGAILISDDPRRTEVIDKSLGDLVYRRP